MRKDYKKFSTCFESLEPPVKLFDRIILAIKREQELRNAKRWVFSFLSLLVISLIAAPFSWNFFSRQVAESGILQFGSIVMSDPSVFLSFWQDFSLAIAESLPIMGLTAFILNIILAVFTLRLFTINLNKHE